MQTELVNLTNADIPKIIRDIEQAKFYGSLEIKFQAGRLVMLRRTETFVSKSSQEKGITRDYNR